MLKNNYKNNLYHTIDFAENKDLEMLNSYIYIDVNKSRENLYLELSFIIQNFLNKYNCINKKIKILLIIIYNDYDYSKPINNWNNSDFFFLLFLLFYYENGGHIASQLIIVFL